MRLDWPSWWPARDGVRPTGRLCSCFILAIAAAEVAVGLALVLQIYHRFKSLDVDASSEMRG